MLEGRLSVKARVGDRSVEGLYDTCFGFARVLAEVKVVVVDRHGLIVYFCIFTEQDHQRLVLAIPRTRSAT